MIKVKTSRRPIIDKETGDLKMKTNVSLMGNPEQILYETAAIFDALRDLLSNDKVDRFIREVLLEEDGKDDKDRNCKGNCKSGREGCCSSESDRDCEGGEK
jgi:hypothetical protein